MLFGLVFGLGCVVCLVFWRWCFCCGISGGRFWLVLLIGFSVFCVFVFSFCLWGCVGVFCTKGLNRVARIFYWLINCGGGVVGVFGCCES